MQSEIQAAVRSQQQPAERHHVRPARRYNLHVKWLRRVALAAAAMALLAQAESHQWKVRLHETSVSQPAPGNSREDPVTLQSVPGGIRWQSKSIAATTVPFADIRSVALDTAARNMAGAILDRAADAQSGHACSVDCIAAIFLSPLFAPFRIRRYYAAVFWQAPSGPRQATFRMSRGDALAFARFVGQSAACPVRDLAAEHRAKC